MNDELILCQETLPDGRMCGHPLPEPGATCPDWRKHARPNAALPAGERGEIGTVYLPSWMWEYLRNTGNASGTIRALIEAATAETDVAAGWAEKP